MVDDLDTLFALAGNTGSPEDWNAYFDPIGLILQIPPKSEGYWCTPRNSLTFARTGGGGTHYSVMSLGGVARAEKPIIMTVPMSDDPNVVVGENLRDFLALGCRYGYFGLEGLVHQPEETLAALARGEFDSEVGEDDVGLLRHLSDTFGLRPWANPSKRLAELKKKYHPQLEVPSESG